MHRQTATARIETNPLPLSVPEREIVTLPLTQEFEAEVLDFLSERSMHTVTMAGFIRDNGLVSDLNRGTFYSCRNLQGKLEGVALIGQAMLVLRNGVTSDRKILHGVRSAVPLGRSVSDAVVRVTEEHAASARREGCGTVTIQEGALSAYSG